MLSSLRRRDFSSLALLGLTPLAWSASEPFPGRPIRIVVPYPPGGDGALYGSSRLPADVLQTLTQSGRAVMASRKTQQAFLAQSNQPWPASSVAELKKRMVIDSVLWNRALAEVGNIE